MPLDGELLAAAADGKVEKVRRLIAGGAHIEENDVVSDGALGGIERFFCFYFCFAQWCEAVNDESSRAWKLAGDGLFPQFL